jgi:hypothetical protein
MMTIYSDSSEVDNNAMHNEFCMTCNSHQSAIDDSLIKLQDQIKKDLHVIDTIKW